jgi:hypothetical protein
MPQKLLKKSGKIAKKVVPPHRQALKDAKQRKGASATEARALARGSV